MALARLKSVAGVTIPDTALCNAAVDLLESSSPEFKLPPFLSEYADGARSRFGIQRAIRIVPQTRDIELTFPYGN